RRCSSLAIAREADRLPDQAPTGGPAGSRPSPAEPRFSPACQTPQSPARALVDRSPQFDVRTPAPPPRRLAVVRRALQSVVATPPIKFRAWLVALSASANRRAPPPFEVVSIAQ